MRNEKIIAVIIFIFSITLSVAFFVFKDFFKGAVSLGLLGLFIINFVSSASLFISAPSMINVFAGGSIYPPLAVAFVSSLGSAGGDIVSFILGFSGRKALNHDLQKHLLFRAFENFFKKHGTWMLFLFSFVPNPVFDSIGIIAGIFHYNPVKFLLVVFLGRLIRYFLVATLGSLV